MRLLTGALQESTDVNSRTMVTGILMIETLRRNWPSSSQKPGPRPQALEWIFSEASCNQFRVSCDNFDERVLDFDRFRVNVQFEVHRWLKEGLPRRANKFTRALLTLTGRHQALDPVTYKEPPQ